MSLESVEELESLPPSETEGAPPPRRRSLSKLKRRLSRTFRLSFSGSLTDFAQTFSIAETAAESEDRAKVRDGFRRTPGSSLVPTIVSEEAFLRNLKSKKVFLVILLINGDPSVLGGATSPG